MPYDAPFFGTDVLHDPPDTGRIALFSHNHDVAIHRDNQLVVLGLNKTAVDLSSTTRSRWYVHAASRTDAALRNLGVAYFQTASDLFKTHRYD